MKARYSEFARMWLLASASATLLSGCAAEIEHRGYIAKPGAFNQINNGMPKTQVEAVLGSPSTTASVKYQGDSYYYITSITEARAYADPKEINRDVVAIRFNQQDQVQSFGEYTLQDGRIVAINGNVTPVIGEDLSILKRIFRGLLNSTASPGNNILKRNM